MSETPLRRDIGGTVVAALLILMGAAMWWDTTSMVDRDSYVFPRAIILIMWLMCAIVIVRNLLRKRPRPASDEPEGSHARRVALVAAMLAGSLAMPAIGFALSGIIVFGVLMVLAMYDPWTRHRLIVYPLVGLALSIGFYLVFKEFFLVPFPEGMLFE